MQIFEEAASPSALCTPPRSPVNIPATTRGGSILTQTDTDYYWDKIVETPVTPKKTEKKTKRKRPPSSSSSSSSSPRPTGSQAAAPPVPPPQQLPSSPNSTSSGSPIPPTKSRTPRGMFNRVVKLKNTRMDLEQRRDDCNAGIRKVEGTLAAYADKVPFKEVPTPGGDAPNVNGDTIIARIERLQSTSETIKQQMAELNREWRALLRALPTAL